MRPCCESLMRSALLLVSLAIVTLVFCVLVARAAHLTTMDVMSKDM